MAELSLFDAIRLTSTLSALESLPYIKCNSKDTGDVITFQLSKLKNLRKVKVRGGDEPCANPLVYQIMWQTG